MGVGEMVGATRAAVIGCGAISHEHLGFLSTSPIVQLVGVCDRSAAAAEFVGERFRAEAVFTDLEAMLTKARPDVVHVLTPPHTHAEVIEACLKRGSHVVCEKPLAPSAEEAARLVTLAQASQRELVESRNLLFNDPVLAIDALIGDGRLGEVREVDLLLSMNLADGAFGDTNLAGPGVHLAGGAVHDFLPHLAYLFLHFIDLTGDVDDVEGVLTNRGGNARVGFDNLDARVTAAGRRGHLRIASDLGAPGFRVWVRGTTRSVEADLYTPFLRVEGGDNVGKRAPLELFVSGLRLSRAGIASLRDKVMQHGTYHGIPRMLDRVYAALRDGTAMPMSNDEMLATARLVDRLVALNGASA